MKKFLAAIAILVVVYAAGWWPQRQRRLALEARAELLERQRAEAEDRVRLASLLGQALHLAEVVAEKNYGEGQKLSSRFFDDVRAESARTTLPGAKSALEAVLALRDPLTARLTQGDAASLELLLQAQLRLRGGLGYPVPASAPAAAPKVS